MYMCVCVYACVCEWWHDIRVVRVSLTKKVRIVQELKGWEGVSQRIFTGRATKSKNPDTDVTCMFKEQSGSQGSWNKLNRWIIEEDKTRGNNGENQEYTQIFCLIYQEIGVDINWGKEEAWSKFREWGEIKRFVLEMLGRHLSIRAWSSKEI